MNMSFLRGFSTRAKTMLLNTRRS